MLTTLPRRLRGLPTPMAGLALGVASLGWCMENALPLNGWGQLIGAFTASALLLLLVLRFVLHAETLWEDLKHPVVGSIVPTFAMSLMVISRALLHAFPTFAAGRHHASPGCPYCVHLVSPARPCAGKNGSLLVYSASGHHRR